MLATALFAVLMLKTEVSARKWRTLSMMVLGVTLVSLENAPDSHVSHSHTNLHEWGELISVDYVVGIALATVQTLLSGFGAIYFEKVPSSGAIPPPPPPPPKLSYMYAVLGRWDVIHRIV